VDTNYSNNYQTLDYDEYETPEHYADVVENVNYSGIRVTTNDNQSKASYFEMKPTESTAQSFEYVVKTS
jgi:hypothetical protein